VTCSLSSILYASFGVRSEFAVPSSKNPRSRPSHDLLLAMTFTSFKQKVVNYY
jgi:hypothetical protein